MSITAVDGEAPLLVASGLRVEYPSRRGRRHRAVDDVTFEVPAGRTVGLVGESGSGKSSIARAIVGLAPATAGKVTFDGEELIGAGQRTAGVRRNIQMVFQDPYSSLDPHRTVGYSVAEPLRHYNTRLSRREVDAAVRDALEEVGVPASAANRYPAQYSGGQRQRIAIARALIVRPRLVICDEALSALDLSVQAQIINVLTEYRSRHGISYLFISHDLGVVDLMCDDVLVLYRGRIVEAGPAVAVGQTPQHPYTRRLLAAVPEVDAARRAEAARRREAFRRSPSPMEPLGDRCEFESRCAFAEAECRDRRPGPRPTPVGTVATCHRLEHVAEVVDVDVPASQPSEDCAGSVGPAARPPSEDLMTREHERWS